MKGHRPDLKSVDGGLLSVPAMPATLPAGALGEWNAIAADLVGRGLLATSMLGLLETYVGALWMTRQCRAAVVEHGALVRSKDGALRPNPAGSMLAKANETVSRLSYEMGISAAGRQLPAIRDQVKEADDAADPLAKFDI